MHTISIKWFNNFAQIPHDFLRLKEFPANKVHGFTGEKTACVYECKESDVIGLSYIILSYIIYIYPTSFRLALRANLSYPCRTLQINKLGNGNGTLQEITRSHVAACAPRKSVWDIEPCKGYLFLYFISLFFHLVIYSFIYLFIDLFI